jgi:hypothetical protein
VDLSATCDVESWAFSVLPAINNPTRTAVRIAVVNEKARFGKAARLLTYTLTPNGQIWPLTLRDLSL